MGMSYRFDATGAGYGGRPVGQVNNWGWDWYGE